MSLPRGSMCESVTKAFPGYTRVLFFFYGIGCNLLALNLHNINSVLDNQGFLL